MRRTTISGVIGVWLVVSSHIIACVSASPASAARDRWDFEPQTQFNEAEFRSRIDTSLKTVRTLLDTNRQPTLPADVSHEYSDKYILAEFIANTAIAAQLKVLNELGLSESRLAELKASANGRTISLRLAATERCAYDRSVVREIESPSVVREHTNSIFSFSTEEKVITKVTDYFWRFEVDYKLSAFTGAGASQDRTIALKSKTIATELKTAVQQIPRSAVLVHPGVDVDITWLAAFAGSGSASGNSSGQSKPTPFHIDRSEPKTCRTPRRNPATADALRFWQSLSAWSGRVRSYFADGVFPIQPNSIEGLNVGAASDDSTVFNPILPLFEEGHKTASVKRQAVGEDSTDSTDSTQSKPAKSTEASTTTTATTTTTTTSTNSVGSGVVPLGLTNTLLAQHTKTLSDKRSSLLTTFPNGGGLITFDEAWIVTLTKNMISLCKAGRDGMDYIESMLYNQLTAAIGKVVQPSDIVAYTRYHMRQLYRPLYQPQAFSYAVRRSGFYPEGVVSIEYEMSDGSESGSGSGYRPIYSVVRGIGSDGELVGGSGSGGSDRDSDSDSDTESGSGRSGSGSSGSDDQSTTKNTGKTTSTDKGTTTTSSPQSTPKQQRRMITRSFPLDATTSIKFSGTTYIHGWVNHQFAGQSSPVLQLMARARQFSSFILLVGRMTSGESFDPQHGLIVQNREELRIPLWLETIPTAAEFRDAIESLSPEQQRFARGFRAMQLESTLFAVCVIQIKPALERVLNLDPKALTKEIELTQDLLSLFIEHQIPSDLLSYQPNVTSIVTAAGTGGGVSSVTGTGTGTGTGATASTNNVGSSPQPVVEVSSADKVNAVRSYVAKMKAYTNPPPPPPPPAPEVVINVRRASMPVNLAGAHPSYVPSSPPMPQTMSMSASAVKTAAAPPPPPPPPPVKQPDANAQPKQPTNQKRAADDAVSTASEDFTLLPRALEAKSSLLDIDSSLRPTIIHTQDVWSRTVVKPARVVQTLGKTEQRTERNRAFDLLDALTKSGDIELDHSELHVLIASTHTFDKSAIMTVVQDNINPIEKLERSSLIVASTIHGLTPEELVQPNQIQRLAVCNPNLLANSAIGSEEEKPLGPTM